MVSTEVQVKPLSVSQKKDKVIVLLTQYGIRLNEVIANCIMELDARDEYVARLREELE